MKTGLVLGIGRQSEAVIRQLSSTNEYHILVLTRNTASPKATKIGELPDVELVANKASHGYDSPSVEAAASKSDFIFVNTDGFELGEQADAYWGMRLFELASKSNVKHLIYSGLDYIGKTSHFDPTLYVGHYEGKARVQEFIHAQKKSPMAWTIIRTGPYIENLSQLMAPTIDEDGTFVFSLPLSSGAIPFIHLDDIGRYVQWALSHPEQSNGLDLGVATAHVSGQEIASTFTAATGKPAKYIDQPTEDWIAKTWKKLPNGPDTKVGFLSVKDDAALLQSYGENFTNWWNLYKASAGNKGLIRRDYATLDKILPSRVKSLEEWMKKVEYTGERDNTLKILD